MGKRIMILEDDMATADLIAFYLMEEGYKVMTANNGMAFFENVNEFQPDLITLDVLLPDLDGISIFRMLQQSEELRDIPVLFVTVYEMLNEVNLRGVSYILKPFEESELKNKIKTFFQEVQEYEVNTSR